MGARWESGKLRYIMELGEHERGAACDCTCISCNQPLFAVNAAKAEWHQRPHFRHESGTEVQNCQVLSARAALLASLQEGDLIVLPQLRRSIAVHGFSKTAYEGWTELPPHSVRVGRLRFTDATTAEVVLDDGRRLKVVVVGSASIEDADRSAGETIVPRIEICIDDPALARLSPHEMRARLVAALEEGLWCGHWRDQLVMLQRKKRRFEREIAEEGKRLNALVGHYKQVSKDATRADQLAQRLEELKAHQKQLDTIMNRLTEELDREARAAKLVQAFTALQSVLTVANMASQFQSALAEEPTATTSEGIVAEAKARKDSTQYSGKQLKKRTYPCRRTRREYRVRNSCYGQIGRSPRHEFS